MVYAVEEQTDKEEHPTAHLRPDGKRKPYPNVQVVTPVYGEFVPNFVNTVYNSSVEAKPNTNKDESVIHDITGTTVYVVGVICVIPVAGLVAWVIRYVVKKKVY